MPIGQWHDLPELNKDQLTVDQDQDMDPKSSESIRQENRQRRPGNLEQTLCTGRNHSLFPVKSDMVDSTQKNDTSVLLL